MNAQGVVEILEGMLSFGSGTKSALIEELEGGSVGTAGTDVFSSKVSGDAQDRFVINADGKLEWGSGAGAVDVNLYRDSANILRTDDQVIVQDTTFAVASDNGSISIKASDTKKLSLGYDGVTNQAYIFAVESGVAVRQLNIQTRVGPLALGAAGGTIGFFGTAPAAKPTGVAVTAAAIHAALITLGLIAA